MSSGEAPVLRDATAADADAILDLHLLSDIAEVGEPNTTIDEVRSDLRAGELASAVVEDGSAGLLAHVWVEHRPGHAKTWGDVTLRPGADPALAERLLAWMRARSRDLAPGLPIHTFADSNDTLKRPLYEAAGGTVIRRYYRMGIRFGATPPIPVPALAAGVEIRFVDGERDLRAMHAVVDVAFEDHFGHEPSSFEQFRKESVEGSCPDLTLWWLATVDDQPAAGLYGCPLSPQTGYVDTLGTLRPYRGRGLAKALLLTAFHEFHRRGRERVVLGVDATNPTGAVALYESVGMTAEHQGMRYEVPAMPTTG